VSSEKSYGRRIAQMATSESRMSALRRRCALTEGLICFFTSRVRVHTSSGRHPFTAKREFLQDFPEKFWQFFSKAMASLIRPEKSKAKWHNFAVERRRRRLAAAGVTRSAGVQEVTHSPQRTQRSGSFLDRMNRIEERDFRDRR
jgi:hypothetical protein